MALRVLAGLFGLATLSQWAYWGYRVLAFPPGENHVGVSPYWGALPFVGLLVVGLWGWRVAPRLARGCVLVAGLSLGALVVLDRASILLSYEAWLARGMPLRGASQAP